jgi:putative ABC transport system permease protein
VKLKPHKLSVRDLIRVGGVGLRNRPLRAFLSALGISIGIAAMLAVVGISFSGRADLDRTLDRLGTNLLTVAAGKDSEGRTISFPEPALPMIKRVGPVLSASGVTRLPDDVNVYRHEYIAKARTSGIVVYSVDGDLPAVVGATVAAGAWFNAATARYPTVVLGSAAAKRLGIASVRSNVVIQLGGRAFAIIGILDPVPLAADLDSAALIGRPAAADYLGIAGGRTTIYVRSAERQVEAVREVLAATANPAAPYHVQVSRPSDALAAKLATDRAFSAVLLGLGAVALLVGGIGVANTMVISVLERRSEIGLRRSLGATKRHVRMQFLTESVLLATLGGVGGVLLGVAVTVAYALSQSWPPTVPLWAAASGIAVTIAVGGLAGIYPAARAAALSPTAALAER